MEKNTTFSEVAALWKADKKQYVKKSTYAAYCLLIQSHLIPEHVHCCDFEKIQPQRDSQSGQANKYQSGITGTAPRQFHAPAFPYAGQTSGTVLRRL